MYIPFRVVKSYIFVTMTLDYMTNPRCILYCAIKCSSIIHDFDFVSYLYLAAKYRDQYDHLVDL